MMSGLDLPQRAIRQQIASAVNLVCHQSRLTDGTRRIVSIAEIRPTDDGEDMVMQDIFLFKRTGIEKETGRIEGHYVYTGARPAFIEVLTASGIAFNESIFAKPETKGWSWRS